MPATIDVDRMLQGHQGDHGLRAEKVWTAFQTAPSILRNLRPSGIPKSPLALESRSDHGWTHGRQARLSKKKRYDWRVFFIAGMWFQDLFNYDFRVRKCASFRTRPRWERSLSARTQHRRRLAEDRRGDVPDRVPRGWYKTNGRHEVFARGGACRSDAPGRRCRARSGRRARPPPGIAPRLRRRGRRKALSAFQLSAVGQIVPWPWTAGLSPSPSGRAGKPGHSSLRVAPTPTV